MSGNGCYGGKEELILEKLRQEDLQEEEATSEARELTRKLLETSGFSPADIQENATISLHTCKGEEKPVSTDFIVAAENAQLLAVKCTMALESRERHILAFARSAFESQIPICVITDGITARVLLTSTGDVISQRPEEFPTRDEFIRLAENHPCSPLSTERKNREAMILMAFEATACPRVEGQ